VVGPNLPREAIDLMSPSREPFATASALLLISLAACNGPILVNRGDFPPPDDPGAPPLPTDYPWGEPKHTDLDHDGKPDLAYYGPDGRLLGAGFDENHDGRIDVYKKYGPDGKVKEETRDTNHDGVLDQRSIDTDGDGKFDKVDSYPGK
jgi:hypothetical protein